jgi:Bacterial type II/III secretion system short domain
MKKGFLTLVMLAVLAALTLPSFAQELTGQASTPQKPETKPMRKELVQLRYVSGADIQQLIYAFLDLRNERVSMSSDKKTLTVTAYPENMEKVLQVIRELDIKPADLLFTVQLVMGSETEEKTDPELQADPIVKELRKLLRYKGYTLLDTSLIRGMDKQRSEVILGRQADFALTMIPDVVKGQPADNIKVELRLRYSARESVPTISGGVTPAASPTVKDLIQSTLSLKSGDKTVVGVSKLDGGDKGLILILSAKVVS